MCGYFRSANEHKYEEYMLCYFVFKSFVDNCQLRNFVSTEMDAEYDTVESKTNPVHAYIL